MIAATPDADRARANHDQPETAHAPDHAASLDARTLRPWDGVPLGELPEDDRDLALRKIAVDVKIAKARRELAKLEALQARIDAEIEKRYGEEAA